MRTSLRACLVVGLAWGMLVASISLGLAAPGLQFLRGFGADGSLDYSHRPGFFTPLTRGFVGRILGLADDPASDNSDRLTRGRTSAARPGRVEDVEHPFTNDDFETAYEVKSLPFRARTNTSGAKRQANEPADCSPSGGTAWYRYRTSNDEALFADTFGASRTTALGVYSGSRPGVLKLIGCDTNVLGNAQVGFRAEANTNYYFQLTGIVGGGPTVFELAAVGPTTIESISSSGGPADDASVGHPDIAGGRYLAFVSLARNLATSQPDCDPGQQYCRSLYLRDRVTGVTTRIAEQADSAYGEEFGEALFSSPSLSGDGRYLGFSAYTFLPVEDADGYRGTPDAERVSFNSYMYDRVTNQVELVSRNSAGEPARTDPSTRKDQLVGGGIWPSVSEDGRFVSFLSDANNMGAQRDPEDGTFLYHRDRLTGTTRLVNVDSSGNVMHGNICAVSGRNISGDGRYVVFMHGRTNTATAGMAALDLVHLWDSRTGRSKLITKLPPGTETRGNYCPTFSLDGSHIGLVSRDALVPEDTNGTPDVYVYALETGRFRRVSVTSAGEQTIDPNYPGEDTTPVLRRAVTLSAEGRFAVFDSAAPNLAPGAVGSTGTGPSTRHIYLHDMLTGATRLVSVSSTGEPLSGDNTVPYISADGRFLSFMNKGSSGLTNVMVHELTNLR